MLGYALFGSRLIGEQPRRTAVALGTFGAGELGVDSAADDRVAERQRPPRREDPGGHEHVCGVGRQRIVEACKLPRLEQVALLEHGERMSEPPGVLRQAAKPQANRATDAAGADSLDVA